MLRESLHTEGDAEEQQGEGEHGKMRERGAPGTEVWDSAAG